MRQENIVPVAVKLVLALAVAAGIPTSLHADQTAADHGESIFNGKDLSGWVVEGTATQTAGGEDKPVWYVEDGMIHCLGHGFGFLRYDRMLHDFRVTLEYNMSEGCNSGVGIRTVKFTGPANTRPSYASYEVQILDDADKPVSKHSSMSLYRYVAPTAGAVKPAGEWNKLEIECRGPKIRITLNGQVVQDIDQSEIDQIKNKPLSGYVCLQNHTRAIQFRNIRLVELQRDEQTSE